MKIHKVHRVTGFWGIKDENGELVFSHSRAVDCPDMPEIFSSKHEAECFCSDEGDKPVRITISWQS